MPKRKQSQILSPNAAFAAVRRRGGVPVGLTLAPGRTVSGTDFLTRYRGHRISQRDVFALTHEFATLLNAGIPLDRAFDKLVAIRPPGRLTNLLRKVSEAVKSGQSLSAALAHWPDVFPAFYCGMVKAGEAGGTLPAVLGDIADILQAQMELKEKITGALLYPIIVMIMVAASLVILMAWVVPEFRPLLEGGNTDPPLSAAVVMALSGIIVDWGWAIALLSLILLAVGLRAIKSPGARRARDRFVTRAPGIGDIVQTLEASRYCRALGTLLANGVSATDAVELAAATIGNTVIAKAFSPVKSSLARGTGLTPALQKTGSIPSMIMGVIEVGEESGRLSEMLLMAADTARDQAQAKIRNLVGILAPAITILLGVLVAVIVGSILSAILSTYDVPF